jgi:hypothetical protein
MNSETSLFSTQTEFDSLVPIMIVLLGIFGIVVLLNYKMKKNRTNKYLDIIRSYGIQAEEQNLNFSPLSPNLKKSFANGIKIFDLDIDFIIVTTHYNELYFWFNYIVNRTTNFEKNWSIETIFKKGSPNKEISTIEWKVEKETEDNIYPNKIADLLNRDYNLSKSLLKRFQSGLPKIIISPFKEEPIIGIGIKLRFTSFKKGINNSKKEDIETFNTIAKYLKE